MKVFGQVLDSDNQPMALANITIVTGEQSNKIGTTTDYDGNFILEDEAVLPNSKFKISYIGYSPQYFETNELQDKKINLLENAELLQEVVITNGSKPSRISTNKNVQSSKEKFIQHLQDHKFIYTGVLGLTGIVLIVRAFKR